MVLVFLSVAMVITVLVSTRVWDPRSQIEDWWTKLTVLSEPTPAWDTRAEGVIDIAAVLSGRVVVGTRGFLAAFRADTGASAWKANASWILPAGDVVLVRERPANPDADPNRDRGYEVRDPQSGSVLWSDQQAIAAWAFSDQIVDLSCPDGADCQLRGRAHRDGGRELWTSRIPGGARTISGAAPGLVGLRSPAESFAQAIAGSPGPIPPVFGITVGGRVQLIDTTDGARLPEVTAPDGMTRVTLANRHVLLSRAEPGGSGCRFTLESHDATTGKVQWRKTGYDLRTASGAGCEQRRDPVGAGGYLVAIGTDNSPLLVDVRDGEPVWSGAVGERILGTDGQLLVVCGADRRSVRVLDLLAADQQAMYSAQLGLDPTAVVTRELVILSDRDQGKIIVLSHSGLSKLTEVKTDASVVGYGPTGVLLGSGRRIGYIPVAR